MGNYEDLVNVALEASAANYTTEKHARETIHAMLHALVTWLDPPEGIKPLRYKHRDGQFVETLNQLHIEETEDGFRFELQLRLVNPNEKSSNKLVGDITFRVGLEPQGDALYMVYVGDDTPLHMDAKQAEEPYKAFCELIAQHVRVQVTPNFSD